MPPRVTRREFLTATGVGACAGSLLHAAAVVATVPTPPTPLDDPACLAGDAYLAFADGPGLGGASFDAARERALRFRTPPAERDHQALGVELGDPERGRA